MKIDFDLIYWIIFKNNLIHGLPLHKVSKLFIVINKRFIASSSYFFRFKLAIVVWEILDEFVKCLVTACVECWMIITLTYFELKLKPHIFYILLCSCENIQAMNIWYNLIKKSYLSDEDLVRTAFIDIDGRCKMAS